MNHTGKFGLTSSDVTCILRKNSKHLSSHFNQQEFEL